MVLYPIVGLVLICLVVFLHYTVWKYSLVKQLNAGSKLIQLSCGQVEYAVLGEGPTLLISHGGGTGYDNIYLYDSLVKKGFRLVCP